MSLTFRACDISERRVAGEDFLADLAAALLEKRTTEEQIEGHLENELAEDLVENTRLTDYLATVTKVAESAAEGPVEELEELEEVEEPAEESAERGIMDAEYYADAANEYDYGYYSPSNNYDYYYDHDVQYTSYDSDY
jgi:hypothetical protein